jgi:hypothetical protein
VQNDSVTFSLPLKSSYVVIYLGAISMLSSFNKTLNVDPFPSSESTVIDPPKNSQIRLHMVRPRPTPFAFIDEVDLSFPNTLNNFLMLSALIPTPVSLTSIYKYLAPYEKIF